MKSLIRVVALATLVTTPLAAQAPVAAAAQPTLSIAVRNQTAADEASHGAARADESVRPGDVLHYTLQFSNASPRAVREVELANPLPAELEYLERSARASRADARLEFSIDGGKSFSAQPMETVTVAGQPVRRAAATSRYTNVRWVVTGSVAAGATVTAEYDARVGGRAAASASRTRPASTPAPSAAAAPRRGTR